MSLYRSLEINPFHNLVSGNYINIPLDVNKFKRLNHRWGAHLPDTEIAMFMPLSRCLQKYYLILEALG